MRLRSAARVEAKGWDREWKETAQDDDLAMEKQRIKRWKEECRTPDRNNQQTSRTDQGRNEQEAKTPVLKNVQVRGNEQTEHGDETKRRSDRRRGALNEMESNVTKLTLSLALAAKTIPTSCLAVHSPNATPYDHESAQKCKESEEGEPCTPVQDTIQDIPPTPLAPKKAPTRTKKRPGDFLMSARRLVFTESNLKKFNDIPSNFPKVKSARH